MVLRNGKLIRGSGEKYLTVTSSPTDYKTYVMNTLKNRHYMPEIIMSAGKTLYMTDKVLDIIGFTFYWIVRQCKQ